MCCIFCGIKMIKIWDSSIVFLNTSVALGSKAFYHFKWLLFLCLPPPRNLFSIVLTYVLGSWTKYANLVLIPSIHTLVLKRLAYWKMLVSFNSFAIFTLNQILFTLSMLYRVQESYKWGKSTVDILLRQVKNKKKVFRIVILIMILKWWRQTCLFCSWEKTRVIT